MKNTETEIAQINMIENNIYNEKQTLDININNHNKIDSILPPIDYNPENKEKEKDDESGTQIQLFKTNPDKQEPLYQLNKSLEKTEDTSKNDSKNEEDPKVPNTQNESFLQKTKRWAGNVWNYVNVANYFPKTEYREYRNANGDWVKIPVKKIPLKNKKIKETEEEHIVNKTVDRDQEKLSFMTIDKIPIPNFN